MNFLCILGVLFVSTSSSLVQKINVLKKEHKYYKMLSTFLLPQKRNNLFAPEICFVIPKMINIFGTVLKMGYAHVLSAAVCLQPRLLVVSVEVPEFENLHALLRKV